MTIYLNSKPYEVEAGTTLASFMDSLAMPLQGVALAIGYEVVPRREWVDILLTDQMELLLIHAVSGG